MLFSVIWMIVIYYAIYRVIKHRKAQGTQSGNKNAQFPQQGIPVQQGNRRTPQQTQNTRQGTNSRQIQNSMQSQRNEPQAGSTLTYLEEKARQDAAEHAKEKREESQRLNKKHGGLRAAERLYEGDSVPGGKRCITCGYCGAENLVPMASKERYSCYFCREALN